MDYAQGFLKELECRNLNNFTHQDILKFTSANCSYSVIRCVKNKLQKDGYRLIELWEENTNLKNETKKYKRYWIEKAIA